MERPKPRTSMNRDVNENAALEPDTIPANNHNPAIRLSAQAPLRRFVDAGRLLTYTARSKTAGQLLIVYFCRYLAFCGFGL